ncbi:hypothetical protein CRG98_021552 [Punica granatum]|uniref:Uncharacterized protein n=1 Tax=Punica granatum TaxID=22663 RepID=A0A2I0JP52_PUNGR|nr:hypothetical protein CRG98_021552 [Punica granatum]
MRLGLGKHLPINYPPRGGFGGRKIHGQTQLAGHKYLVVDTPQWKNIPQIFSLRNIESRSANQRTALDINQGTILNRWDTWRAAVREITSLPSDLRSRSSSSLPWLSLSPTCPFCACGGPPLLGGMHAWPIHVMRDVSA